MSLCYTRSRISFYLRSTEPPWPEPFFLKTHVTGDGLLGEDGEEELDGDEAHLGEAQQRHAQPEADAVGHPEEKVHGEVRRGLLHDLVVHLVEVDPNRRRILSAIKKGMDLGGAC